MNDIPKDIFLEILQYASGDDLINRVRFVSKEWNQAVLSLFNEMGKREFQLHAETFARTFNSREFHFINVRPSKEPTTIREIEECNGSSILQIAKIIETLSDDELSHVYNSKDNPMKKTSLVCLGVLLNRPDTRSLAFELVTKELQSEWKFYNRAERDILQILLTKIPERELTDLSVHNMQDLQLKMGNIDKAKELISKVKTSSEQYHACERVINAFLKVEKYSEARTVVGFISNQLFRPVLLKKIHSEEFWAYAKRTTSDQHV